ncbi:MAG TPA: SIS domain-containing protein [Methylophilaceae bacterium]|nr:SIS domain-containing protein [Methylophilaceae bacterium]
MQLSSRISAHFEESGQLKLALAELLAAPIAQAAELIAAALLQEKKILTCGNGGSAALAQYFASRMLNRYEMERPSLAAIALSADSITLSTIANDGHFDYIYSKQVNALGQANDVLLALSSSGNSPNILQAVAAARECGMQVIALSGGDGGSLMELLSEQDIHIGVPHDNAARIQEVYILILHCLCDAIDCLLLGAN